VPVSVGAGVGVVVGVGAGVVWVGVGAGEVGVELGAGLLGVDVGDVGVETGLLDEGAGELGAGPAGVPELPTMLRQAAIEAASPSSVAGRPGELYRMPKREPLLVR
jgi:hypothetical protein